MNAATLLRDLAGLRPRFRAGAAIAMLIACTVAGSATAADGAQAPATTALVESIGAKLDAEYIYPDIAKAMAKAIRTHDRHGDYRDVPDGAALADKLTADLREVSHDRHLWVEHHAEGARDEPAGGPSIADLKTWRADVARDNFAFDKVERMDGNVGYIAFRLFAYPYLAADTASAAMSFVANTDALIIDLRRNQGGDPAMVAFMASYLFDERTHLNDIRVRNGDRLEQYWTLPSVPGQVFGGSKPVFILTSHATFSGAEDFTYALKNLERAQVVGETTGGGAHPTLLFRVADHYAVSVPIARSISPITHTDWEGSGVTPDIATTADAALDVAYTAALEGLRTHTQDVARRNKLTELIAQRKRASDAAVK